jgi:short-subunit dehydrogenase
MKTLDLTCEKSIENFVHQVQEEKWTFDAIVNNAAMGFDLGDKVPEPKWTKALLYSNVVGTIFLMNRNHKNDKFAASQS